MRMQLDGIVPQIMSLPPHMLEAKPTDPSAAKTWQYPPVYFMHMELDRATAQRVTADINVLKTKQVKHSHSWEVHTDSAIPSNRSCALRRL